MPFHSPIFIGFISTKSKPYLIILNHIHFMKFPIMVLAYLAKV